MTIYSPIIVTDKIRANFRPARLYIKEINGVFYFGKTTKINIIDYVGSGTIWKKRVRKYGKESVITHWVSDYYNTPEEIQDIALHFSEENSIVESDKWANLVPENGIGGGAHPKSSYERMSKTKKGKTLEEIVGNEMARKIKENLSSRIVTVETRSAMSKAKKGKFIGIAHNQFKGFYITPWGEFTSAAAAVATFPGNPINEGTVRAWCINNNHNPITNHTISRNIYFSKEQKGLTFNQLGFGFREQMRMQINSYI